MRKVFTELKPNLSVVAAGSAQFDIFQPVLMRMGDILKFMKNAPGKVLANHLEGVNHCPTQRSDLKQEVAKAGLAEKVWVPDDGECMTY